MLLQFPVAVKTGIGPRLEKVAAGVLSASRFAKSIQCVVSTARSDCAGCSILEVRWVVLTPLKVHFDFAAPMIP